jgi:hypothetical protein
MPVEEPFKQGSYSPMLSALSMFLCHEKGSFNQPKRAFSGDWETGFLNYFDSQSRPQN